MFLAITGGLFSGTISALRQPSVSAVAVAASGALNSGMAGTTFFSIREYFVSPLLLLAIGGGQYAQRRATIDGGIHDPSFDGSRSWSKMRTHKLLDSTLAGGITGSVLYTLTRSCFHDSQC